MTLTVVNAGHDVERAFQETEDRLRRLERRPDNSGLASIEADLVEVRKEISKVARAAQVDPFLDINRQSRIPYVLAYHNAVQSHTTSNTWQVLALNSELHDTNSMHDNSTNNSRVTIHTSGWYRIKMRTVFDANATGFRGIEGYKNGAVLGLREIEFHTAHAVQARTLNLSFFLPLLADDYIEMFAFQDSGGALNILSVALASYIYAEWAHTL